MSNIRIGDKVKISDYEMVYPYYKGFIVHNRLHDCVDKFINGAVPNPDGTFIVLKLRQDPRKEGIVRMAIIMDSITGQFYVVRVIGLELVKNSNESQQAAQDLLSIITDILYHTTNYESLDELQEQIEEVYCRPEMVRLRNFIENK